jgi:very-short-patch-repair endonuclease
MTRPRPLPIELELAPFSVGEARELGVGRHRLRAADLHSPFHGVRATASPSDVLEACRAYLPKLRPGQYFSHVTAARLWHLPVPEEHERDLLLHVSTSGREPHGAGVVGHRMAGPRDIRFVHELPVLAPCDAWCQLGAFVTGDDLIAAGDRLLGWPTPLAEESELDDAITRFGSRRGARAIARARREIRARSASARETQIRLTVLRARRFPDAELNGRIDVSTGGVTHGDLVFRAFRVILEYDGGQHRTSERQFLRDVERLNDLAQDGWLVIRTHKRTPETEILARLDGALRSRGWRP